MIHWSKGIWSTAASEEESKKSQQLVRWIPVLQGRFWPTGHMFDTAALRWVAVSCMAKAWLWFLKGASFQDLRLQMGNKSPQNKVSYPWHPIYIQHQHNLWARWLYYFSTTTTWNFDQPILFKESWKQVLSDLSDYERDQDVQAVMFEIFLYELDLGKGGM